MTKSELAGTLADKAGLSLAQAERVVDAIFDSMLDAFRRDESIYLRGFGSFMLRKYQPYTGRNPKTGQKVPVGHRRIPLFIVSEEMRQRVMTGGKGPFLVHSGPGEQRPHGERTGDFSRDGTPAAAQPEEDTRVKTNS